VRYFCISEIKDEVPVAVVFHDYKDGSCICRSKKESFFKSFELLRTLSWTKTSKEVFGNGGALRLVSMSANDYEWIDSVLNTCLGGYWAITKEGTCVNDESSIDEAVGEFLG
jgi:ribosomal protein L24E